MEDKDRTENSLTSSDFGRLLIGSYSKLMAAQEIQANMLASIIAGANPEKHEKIMALYFQDVNKSADKFYENTVRWLNEESLREREEP